MHKYEFIHCRTNNIFTRTLQILQNLLKLMKHNQITVRYLGHFLPPILWPIKSDLSVPVSKENEAVQKQGSLSSFE